MSQRIYQVDAFTRQPFHGNPAGVCILPQPVPEAWMMAVAGEMNLSETAFLVREGEGYHLRWFTPKKEVRLCGHATLASAHILWETGAIQPGEQARFSTLSGLLTANLRGNWIEMDFPAREDEPSAPPEGLLDALGVEQPVHVGKNGQVYLVETAGAQAIREMQPDYTKLEKLPVRSVIVTARSDTPGYDFISRYFAPAVGINEDPVTGSAHCRLAPYWAAKLSKTEMAAYQASPRGGELRVRLSGDRVILCGQAVTMLVGALSV